MPKKVVRKVSVNTTSIEDYQKRIVKMMGGENAIDTEYKWEMVRLAAASAARSEEAFERFRKDNFDSKSLYDVGRKEQANYFDLMVRLGCFPAQAKAGTQPSVEDNPFTEE